MILEEETFKEFGYYPSELTPQSGKWILAACDECGMIRERKRNRCSSLCRSCSHKGEKHHLFGKHLSIETREKLSKAHKGQVPWNKGGTLSEEHKQKLSDAKTGERHHNFGKHLSKETRRKLRIKRKARKFPTHHTKPEQIFEQICKRNNLDFHYVGDGSLWIGKKEEKQLNPDFIEANGKKIIVEVFGDYWHSPLLNMGMKESSTLEYRKRHYKQFGWKSIFLWESDLKREDAEQFVLNQLEKGDAI